MTNSQKAIQISSTTGFAVIAAAMAIPIIAGPSHDVSWFRYLFAAGALIMLVCSLLSPNKHTDTRLRRLQRLQGWSSIFFCAAVFFMFWPGASMRDWVAFTLAGAFLRGYSAIAMAARQNKLMKEGKKD